MDKVRLDKILESLKSEVKFWQTFIAELEANRESEEYLRARDALRFAELRLSSYEQERLRPEYEILH